MLNLRQHIEPAPTGQEPIYFAGIPTQCDLCDCTMHDNQFIADAFTPASDCWALLCQQCITDNHVVFGWGVGQLYQKQFNNPSQWLLVAGYPTESINEND